jgi:hypothetical protein
MILDYKKPEGRFTWHCKDIQSFSVGVAKTAFASHHGIRSSDKWGPILEKNSIEISNFALLLPPEP